MKQKVSNKKGMLAIIQIIILILGTIAFVYIIGSEIKVVKADGMPQDIKTPDIKTPELPVNPLGAFGTVGKIALPAAVIKSIPSATAVTAAGASTGTTGAAAESTTGWLEKTLGEVFSPGTASTISSILASAAWAAGAYIAVKWVGSALGLQSGAAKALAAGAATGVFVGVAGAKFGLGEILSSAGLPGLGWIAAGIGLLVTLLTWKSEKTSTAVFTCSLWQPEPGGKNCEKCNDGLFPCSEYQCASLGVSCQIVNKGTKEQKCIWVDRNDVTPPIMTPLQEALKPGYYYNNNSAVSPPDRGVKILYSGSSDGCIPPYTPFSFGIKVNQNAKCRVDVMRKSNFSSMDIPLDGERYLKEHTITLALPNSKDLEAENIINITGLEGGNKLYIRCLGGNGIESNANLEFSYCIQSGPDLNPPEIRETSITNNSPVSFGVGSINLTVSVNKPAQCKWSILDRTYGDMENTMSCSTKASQANARQLYDCETTLTGIKDREINNFYFRCNGTYNGKTNPASYLFTLKGTQPLVIDEVGPNGTIKDSTDTVKVTLTAETSAGYNSGEATCQYSKTGIEGSYFVFYNTYSYTHSQELSLAEGDYTYYIKCFDPGGNEDIKTANFTVETDSDSPVVVRAFHESNYLKIITNEDAECVYDTVECNYAFDDGISMTTLNDNEHYTDWNTLLNFYIKCRDEYGNQPAQDECSIIARPFAL